MYSILNSGIRTGMAIHSSLFEVSAYRSITLCFKKAQYIFANTEATPALYHEQILQRSSASVPDQSKMDLILRRRASVRVPLIL